MRYAVPASLWHRPKPSVAWAFGGVKVHRTFTCFRLTHWSFILFGFAHGLFRLAKQKRGFCFTAFFKHFGV